MNAGNRAAASDTPATLSTQPWTVLCVDDEHDVLSLTKQFLNRVAPNITIDTHTNPRAALTHLAADQWDCVISDYRMPEMNGLEFRAKLRETHPQLPFLLYTTDNTPTIEARVLDDPHSDFTLKRGDPAFGDVLISRITPLIQHSESP